ncbi:MAG: immune inhibitor A [Anaerolineae bacterium]|nr:immune inhibitor A [Anaerolineae bacterium]
MRFHRPHILLTTLLLAVSIAACAPSAAPPTPAAEASGPLARAALLPTPTPVESSGLLSEITAQLPDTAQQIATVYLPPRDRNALAQRLLGVPSIPTPPTAPERTWQAGDVADFWVENVDANTQAQTQATLRAITEHAYVWVESTAGYDAAALQASADTFSSHTYPILHDTFGSEWSPGIDGDPRVHILLATNMGYSVAAYYVAASEYPVEAVPSSNEREMFFVNLDTMADSIGTAYFDGVLAHEFQHMIHWNQDRNEDTWITEGLSELAALLTGFDHSGFAADFLRQPDTQLTAWPSNAAHAPHYGASFLFITYLYGRFGPALIRPLMAEAANGLAGIDAALTAIDATDAATGKSVTAHDMFADWLVANLVRDPALDDGRYGYTLLDPALPTVTQRDPITVYPATQSGVSLPQYGAHYLPVQHVGPGRVRLDFAGSETVRLVPTDAYSGARMWYSNRGDSSDSTLTRAFDLSGVTTATLHFATWYDLEYLWDYAYVMASTDDGATWTLLETGLTTTDDPHGNAYGPGYTGSTGSNTLGPVGWVEQQADLTPFAGGRVLIRFEMITDEATSQPGMVIDDVRIPEIGYAEDFEQGGGGWAAEGWLLIDNVLAQDWLVQWVQVGQNGLTVTRLLEPGDGAAGTWEFEVGGPAGDGVLVISPLAPLTTEPAQYEYTLTRLS